jgi:acetyl esterase/lipase
VTARSGVLLLLLLAVACGGAARDDTAYGGGVSVWRDVAYGTLSKSQRLDVYVPRDRPSPPPLVVFAHGGGWMDLAKEDAELSVASYLSAGWAVANVEYRRGREAPAPAAAIDVRCAVRWMSARAAEYGVDVSRIVLAGESAGAHLMLLTAFADSTAGLDTGCAGAMPAVAAVVNWAGVSDVTDLLSGANARGWAVGWIGPAAGAAERARRLSPIEWVRTGVPPVITVHGDRDETVPFSQAQRLHAALDSAGVPNLLVALPGANHGPWPPSVAAPARSAILKFLADRGAELR